MVRRRWRRCGCAPGRQGGGARRVGVGCRLPRAPLPGAPLPGSPPPLHRVRRQARAWRPIGSGRPSLRREGRREPCRCPIYRWLPPSGREPAEVVAARKLAHQNATGPPGLRPRLHRVPPLPWRRGPGRHARPSAPAPSDRPNGVAFPPLALKSLIAPNVLRVPIDFTPRSGFVTGIDRPADTAGKPIRHRPGSG